MAVWQDPALDAEQIAWARDGATAIEPWSFNGGGYVNYMQADEPIERVRATFGIETFDRLQKLKQQYDPRNILHRNQNISPFWAAFVKFYSVKRKIFMEGVRRLHQMGVESPYNQSRG